MPFDLTALQTEITSWTEDSGTGDDGTIYDDTSWAAIRTAIGKAGFNIVSKSGAYTATDTDTVILGDVSLGGWTLALPAAATSGGFAYYVKKIDSSANSLTINPNASETIDGATTLALIGDEESVTIVCDGTNWRVIGRGLLDASGNVNKTLLSATITTLTAPNITGAVVFDAALSGITTLAMTGAISGGTTATWSGSNFIGDTSNAKMTQGLTINQGANDDEIVALKSSDVVHPMTAEAETDTFGWIQKESASAGGMMITGLRDSSGAAEAALSLRGFLGEAADTTKSTAGGGVVNLNAFVTNGGTSVAAPAADANLFVIHSGGSARFIFDQEGQSHQDVGTAWTEYDDYDDIAVLDSLQVELQHADSPTRIKIMAREALKGYGRDWLTRHKLVTFNDNGHHFVNRSQMQNLLIGATRQVGRELSELTERLVLTEQKLMALEA